MAKTSKNAINYCNSLWENLEDVDIIEETLLLKLKVMGTLELSNLLVSLLKLVVVKDKLYQYVGNDFIRSYFKNKNL